jgi:hypothetical protein
VAVREAFVENFIQRGERDAHLRRSTGAGTAHGPRRRAPDRVSGAMARVVWHGFLLAGAWWTVVGCAAAIRTWQSGRATVHTRTPSTELQRERIA